ncbi:MAG: sigma-70 family RNA polymerase sigma factor [Candidatus Limnocylindrales bacterium]
MIDRPVPIERLYRDDGEKLWRALYGFGGDAEIASEALNEAFAQLIRRGDGVRDPAAWVWRTAFRLARGLLAERRTRDDTWAEQDPGASDIDRYANPDLLRALRQLPDSQRAAVVLFYYADLPIRQIADRLGSNGLAVRANLSRGRRRLRTLLGDSDD